MPLTEDEREKIASLKLNIAHLTKIMHSNKQHKKNYAEQCASEYKLKKTPEGKRAVMESMALFMNSVDRSIANWQMEIEKCKANIDSIKR